jgi:hypothetical protein
MKKVTLTLALVIVALLFASCKKENKLEQQIIGKWITADINGQPAITNKKVVTTFITSTSATMSSSFDRDNGDMPGPPNPEQPTPGGGDNDNPDGPWKDHQSFNVSITGNTITLTYLTGNGNTWYEYVVNSITDSEMNIIRRQVEIRDGETTIRESKQRLVKVAKDYQEATLGLWECTELTGIETYNDANARLEFFADGNYNYWRKDDAGQWLPVTDREFQNYFVDGTLLATRWKVIGESELHEWWEIASIADNQMVWTALRQNADGSTVQQGMKWKRVE